MFPQRCADSWGEEGEFTHRCVDAEAKWTTFPSLAPIQVRRGRDAGAKWTDFISVASAHMGSGGIFPQRCVDPDATWSNLLCVCVSADARESTHSCVALEATWAKFSSAESSQGQCGRVSPALRRSRGEAGGITLTWRQSHALRQCMYLSSSATRLMALLQMEESG